VQEGLGARRRGEQGQVIIIGAVMMTALFGFLALVLDIGNAYAQRRFVQNGADAAAIAASRLLANNLDTGTGDATVVAVLNQYLSANNDGSFVAGAALGAAEGAWYVTPTGTRIAPIGAGIGVPPAGADRLPQIAGQYVGGVEVVARKQFDTLVAGVIGYETMTVRAEAVGQFGAEASQALAPPDGPRIMPLAIGKHTFDQALGCGIGYDLPITFANGITDPFSCNGTNGQGGFQWSPLHIAENFSNSIAKDLLEPVTPYADQVLSIGEEIRVASGERAVDYAMLNDYWAGQDVLVPIVDVTGEVDCHPHCDEPVLRFAWFHVTYAGGSSPKTIEGYFRDPREMPTVVGGSVGSSTTITGPVTFALTR
jgi:hypothetical protein